MGPFAGVTVVVAGLAAGGAVPPWPGVVHLVGLPPLDLFADARVLLVLAPSWPWFAVGLAGVVAVRVMVLAMLLGGLHRWRRAALCYGLALPPLLLAAQLDYMAYALRYSRLFWPAAALAIAVVLTLAPSPWRTGGGGRVSERPEVQARVERRASSVPGRFAVLVPYAVVVTVLGVAAGRGGWVAVALVPVSAVATLVAGAALARPARPARRWTVVPLAVLTGAAGVAFVVTRGGPDAPYPPVRAGSLVLMSGINSASGKGAVFRTDVRRLGFTCAQTYYVSYAGPGGGAARGEAACPIRGGAPYGPSSTRRPVREQVDAFAAQVRGLPEPVTVVALSQGAWVAWEAVASGRAPGVRTLVLAGPFGGRSLGYRAPGDDGPGRVAGDLLRALAALAGRAGFAFAPDSPGARELLGTAGAGGAILARPVPDGVRTMAVTSTTDLPLTPSAWRLNVDRNACPVRANHSALPTAPGFARQVGRFLDGAGAPRCPRWRAWGAPMIEPFGVPIVDAVTYR